jgi:hypothetical protein
MTLTWLQEQDRKAAAEGGAVRHWKQRNGAKVPAVECLLPAERVSVREFSDLMDEMGASGLDLGDLVAP